MDGRGSISAYIQGVICLHRISMSAPDATDARRRNPSVDRQARVSIVLPRPPIPPSSQTTRNHEPRTNHQEPHNQEPTTISYISPFSSTSGEIRNGRA